MRDRMTSEHDRPHLERQRLATLAHLHAPASHAARNAAPHVRRLAACRRLRRSTVPRNWVGWPCARAAARRRARKARADPCEDRDVRSGRSRRPVGCAAGRVATRGRQGGAPSGVTLLTRGPTRHGRDDQPRWVSTSLIAASGAVRPVHRSNARAAWFSSIPSPPNASASTSIADDRNGVDRSP